MYTNIMCLIYEDMNTKLRGFIIYMKESNV